MHKEELRAIIKIEPRLFDGLITSINDIVIEKELVRLRTFSMAISSAEEALKEKILGLLQKGGFQPPSKEELSQSLKLDQKHLSDILKLMVKEGSLIRINDSLYLTSPVYERMIEAIKNFFGRKQEMTVAEFRDLLGTTRKYALPFLEYLDSNKVTMRVGDVRKFLLP
jgi:selenocysteine-specific elongation factor